MIGALTVDSLVEETILMQIFIIVIGVTKVKQGDLMSEMFWGFWKSALKLNFEGWEGVSKVKMNGLKMGGKALDQACQTLSLIYFAHVSLWIWHLESTWSLKDTEGIKNSMRERIKVWCDWRFDNKGELASDVAEVNRGCVVLDYVEIVKGFLFCPKNNGMYLRTFSRMNLQMRFADLLQMQPDCFLVPFSLRGICLVSKCWMQDWKVWNCIYTNETALSQMEFCCVFIIVPLCLCPAQCPYSDFWPGFLLVNINVSAM